VAGHPCFRRATVVGFVFSSFSSLFSLPSLLGVVLSGLAAVSIGCYINIGGQKPVSRCFGSEQCSTRL